MRNFLENQPMVKIKRFWVVIFVLANKRLQTDVITWKINRWLKLNSSGWLFLDFSQ